MEHFSWLLISLLITSVYGDTDIRCELVDDETCQGFGYDAFAAYIADLPELVDFANKIQALKVQFIEIPVCREFFTISECLIMFPPCNNETGKLRPICQKKCSIITTNVAQCVQILVERMMDFIEIALISSVFNCSDPSSYYPNVSGTLYDLQENCFNFAVRDINESDENPVLAIIIGPIVLTVVLGVIVVLIIVYWKYRHRNIILVGGSLSLNSSYGQDVIGLGNAFHKLPILQNEERERLVNQYEIELDDILIPSDALHLITVIGEGAFGLVYESVYTNPKTGTSINVAIKGLKASTAINEVEAFLEECCKMKLLDHPNVLPLIGVSIDSEYIPAMVLPYMVNGDVKSYLLSERNSETDVDTFPVNITYKILHKMCYDIANGMQYLRKLHLIHRDLAARNCMVDEDKTVKISDFGFCRDVYVSDYYRLSKSSRVPVKWMPPESLHDGMYSHQSDVWSYGVTCWEIFSLGRQPYPGVENCDITQYLSEGKRLNKPVLCSHEMYQIMLSCWKDSPSQRLSFTAIVQTLETQLKADTVHN
ncbi:tyrosine-protein kinase receptor TYRO3-like isoform X2 [Dysidea avara]